VETNPATLRSKGAKPNISRKATRTVVSRRAKPSAALGRPSTRRPTVGKRVVPAEASRKIIRPPERVATLAEGHPRVAPRQRDLTRPKKPPAPESDGPHRNFRHLGANHRRMRWACLMPARRVGFQADRGGPSQATDRQEDPFDCDPPRSRACSAACATRDQDTRSRCSTDGLRMKLFVCARRSRRDSLCAFIRGTSSILARAITDVFWRLSLTANL
jgi:hypothetical protein